MLKFALTNSFVNKILQILIKKRLKKKLGKDAVIDLNCMSVVEEGSRLKMKLDVSIDMYTATALDLIEDLII